MTLNAAHARSHLLRALTSAAAKLHAQIRSTVGQSNHHSKVRPLTYRNWKLSPILPSQTQIATTHVCPIVMDQLRVRVMISAMITLIVTVRQFEFPAQLPYCKGRN